MSFLSSVRARARLVFGRRAAESRMNEELRFHLEMEAERLMREGFDALEAHRRARVAFGGVEKYREELRDGRGLAWLSSLRLDVKLGLRMLVKYPGLSAVAVTGMAVAVAVGAGGFGFIDSMVDPRLPMEGGERLVSLQNNDARNPGNPHRQSLHDFVLWRNELKLVADLSAFTADRRNLIIPGGGIELVRVAEITASGFRAASSASILGRPLIDEDELRGAPSVVVIGYEEWQHRFDGDPGVVGRSIRLGSTLHTIVGVMPQGFRFPLNHQYWIPLRLNPDDYARGGGPAIHMFGRLADGATLEQAQAELKVVGQRMSAALPETHEHLRPRVLPYTYAFFDIDSPWMAWALRAVQLALALLLVVVAVNVAILIYARTAARMGEIAVRSALGASRRRVVTQLFAEALVLSLLASVIGLAIASVALEKIQEFLIYQGSGEFPFWWDLGLSASMVVYVAGLTILGGVIIGVLPALKATGRDVQTRLQQLTARGSQMQLGRTWTVLIVLQVAIAVAAMPYALYVAGRSVSRGTADPGYPASEILRATLSLEREETPPTAEAAAYERTIQLRFRNAVQELERRLQAESAVEGVTVAQHFPGEDEYGRIEVESTAQRRTTRINQVEVSLFRVLHVPIVAGRDFAATDSTRSTHAIIVDQTFAQRILGGGNVIGRRIRHVVNRGGDTRTEAEVGPWLEIVGVVRDFTIHPDFETPVPKLYEAVPIVEAPVVALALRIRDGPPVRYAARLRQIAATVDPDLQLHELKTAANGERKRQQGLLFIALLIVAVTGSVLLLSAAGIYAMMSFTVARRRREIGIRAALGANPRRLLGAIFALAIAQLGTGVLSGLTIASAVGLSLSDGPFAGRDVMLLPVVAGLMLMVGLLAALGPARRGLAVQPSEALRAE
ncbi:MAG TPA: ABC transporter permease [Longimicrobiales bacterium]|nr:ABC transporter permease [Longimicrobiales bacterium]